MATQIRYTDLEGNPIEAQKFDPFELVVVASSLAFGVAHAARQAVYSIDLLLRAHANYRRDQSEYVADFIAEIERL